MQQTGEPRSGERIRAIIIDDQHLFRLGLRLYLSQAMPEVEMIGEADSGRAGIALARAEQPDLVLIDASLPDPGTEELLTALREVAPQARLVLLVTSSGPEDLALAIRCRVDGCLPKVMESRQLVRALRDITNGKQWTPPEPTMRRLKELSPTPAGRVLPESAQPLTPRQLDVLRLVTRGLSNPEIARRLHIGNETVKSHLTLLLRKLGVRSRVQAAAYAVRNGLVET